MSFENPTPLKSAAELAMERDEPLRGQINPEDQEEDLESEGDLKTAAELAMERDEPLFADKLPEESTPTPEESTSQEVVTPTVEMITPSTSGSTASSATPPSSASSMPVVSGEESVTVKPNVSEITSITPEGISSGMYQEVRVPVSEGPLKERLEFADDILNKLNEREEQRQYDRYKTRPLGFLTPPALEKFATNIARKLNSSDKGKLVKIAGKVLLGTGAVAASLATGGAAGMALAPLLFSGGIKTAVSGVVEGFQEVFGAAKRNPETGKLEMHSSRHDRLKLEAAKRSFFANAAAEIEALKQQARDGMFSETELLRQIDQLAGELEAAERDIVITSENKVIKKENSRKKIRGIISSVAAVAGGYLHGVPLGKQEFDGIRPDHMVNFTTHGFGFEYNPGEHAAALAKIAAQPLKYRDTLTTFSALMGNMSHALGGMPPNIAFGGLGAAAAALMGQTYAEMRNRPEVDSPELFEEGTIWRNGEGSSYGSMDLGSRGGSYDLVSRGASAGSSVELASNHAEAEAALPKKPEELQTRAEQLSPRLKENPQAKLDHKQEIVDYFGRQSKELVEHAESLAEQVGEMDPECRVSVCIPVAGHQEGKNIYSTLEWYAKQCNADNTPVDPKSFEVVLYVNHPDDKQPDSTLSEIERFKADHPEVPIRMMYEPLARENANMRYIRKSLNDATLVRQRERSKDRDDIPDLYMISNDADCVGMSPYYLARIMSQFNKAEENGVTLDGIGGKLDWDPEAYREYPLVHTETRFVQYLTEYFRNPKGGPGPAVPASGGNFAFKSSIYAAVGGYRNEPGSPAVGEDSDLGRDIQNARGDKHTTAYGGKHSLIYSNARRSIEAFKRGLTFTQQWSQMAFSPDDELRNAEPEESTADTIEEIMADPAKLEAFRNRTEKFVNQVIHSWNIPANHKSVEKTLGFLGVQFETDDSNVHITDVSNLVTGLKDYHDEVAVQRFQQNVEKRPGGTNLDGW